MTTRENPYRPSQEQLSQIEPAGNFWREGEFLVVHTSKSALPNRCLFCDGPPSWRGKLSIRKPVSWPFLIAVLVVGPLALFLFLVMPRARVLASLCAYDASSVKLRKLMVYVPLMSALLAIAASIFAAAGIIPMLATSGFDFAMFFVFVLSALALVIGLILALIVSRPVTVFREHRSYFWLKGTPASFLSEAPPIANAESQN